MLLTTPKLRELNGRTAMTPPVSNLRPIARFPITQALYDHVWSNKGRIVPRAQLVSDGLCGKSLLVSRFATGTLNVHRQMISSTACLPFFAGTPRSTFWTYGPAAGCGHPKSTTSFSLAVMF